jgi:hypothetical protein
VYHTYISGGGKNQIDMINRTYLWIKCCVHYELLFLRKKLTEHAFFADLPLSVVCIANIFDIIKLSYFS